MENDSPSGGSTVASRVNAIRKPSLADWSFRFMEKYNPAILQVKVDRNDATLTIYQGDEETYGDSASLELY